MFVVDLIFNGTLIFITKKNELNAVMCFQKKKLRMFWFPPKQISHLFLQKLTNAFASFCIIEDVRYRIENKMQILCTFS